MVKNGGNVTIESDGTMNSSGGGRTIIESDDFDTIFGELLNANYGDEICIDLLELEENSSSLGYYCRGFYLKKVGIYNTSTIYCLIGSYAKLIYNSTYYDCILQSGSISLSTTSDKPLISISSYSENGYKTIIFDASDVTTLSGGRIIKYS